MQLFHTPLYTLIFACFLSSVSLNAQVKKQENSFGHEVTAGAGLHTRGYTLSLNYVRFQNSEKAFLALVDFAEIKNPKERRTTAETRTIGGNQTNGYIFGKQNNLFAMRLGVGQRLYISDKNEKSNVALAFVYSGGANLGMLKPYYLDLIYRTDAGVPIVRTEAYSAANHDLFTSPEQIDGAGGFGRGWDDLTLAPGIFGKAALVFDWGPSDEVAKILEIGLSTDIYFRKIPIMIDMPNSPMFINLYLNVLFGKRW